MADQLRVVGVAVEILQAEPGHWCTRCALPSGWIVWVVVRHGARMHLQEQRYCDECGSRRTVVPADG
ncbi:hypothetical protein [Pimelobacter simplex]|uniref:hypothetical protein n=1 Tax=Nocardioides simplex TaxID=2045 RepID=UPI0021501DDB|nr:hypothetical protein [Pimelobacter simplex]UUW88458.1 hypothetical protein M0M43_22325 [Pimelobacter simplex]UUW97962.1 hypothetical protein M0M48_10970 [Pimelobacter simplex]